VDSQTHLGDVAAVAALFQCLLVWLAERHDLGEALAVDETSRIAENVWPARRYGTRGFMVDPSRASRSRPGLVSRSCSTTSRPRPSGTGRPGRVLTARALLADNGADRQRYVATERGLMGLTRWLAQETVSSARDHLERRT
jgi:gamma-glutamyl:cysteine ligase YbdK (ATP-grasp superfamily)